MPDHKRRLLCSIGLPTTARQDLAAGFDFEQALFVAGAIAGAESPGPKVCAQGLRVALFEQAMRNEGFGFEVADRALKQGGDVGFIVGHRFGFSPVRSSSVILPTAKRYSLWSFSHETERGPSCLGFI